MKRNFLLVGGLILAAVILANPGGTDCANGACRPKRSIAARLIDWAAWLRLAPIRQDEPAPAPVRMATNGQQIRATGPDGYPEIAHGNGW